MSFRPVRTLRVAEQVASAISDAIVGGRFAPGDALPSERSLAEQFAVNRSTVREALHRLEAIGIVEVRHGGATRVRDVLTSAGLQLLPHLLAPGGQLDAGILRDLVEMRELLLGFTARLAARNADEAGVARMRELVAALEGAEDTTELQEADWAFFAHLVDMTGNRVLALIAHSTRRVYVAQRELFSEMHQGFDASRHREAADAIARGDEEVASEAMRAYGREALGWRSS